jgi:hypothetical protein
MKCSICLINAWPYQIKGAVEPRQSLFYVKKAATLLRCGLFNNFLNGL